MIDDASVRSSGSLLRMDRLGLLLLFISEARDGVCTSVTVLSRLKAVTVVDGVIVSSGTLLESGTSSEMASVKDSVSDFKRIKLNKIQEPKVVSHHPTLLPLNAMDTFIVVGEYRLYNASCSIPLRWL